MLLPAADRQQFIQAFQLDHPAAALTFLATLLEAFDRLFRHQAVAMDAHEARGKLLFQRGERFLEQIFMLGGAHRDVFQLGAQE